MHHVTDDLLGVRIVFAQQREGEDLRRDTQVADSGLREELHRVEDVEILRHAEDLLFVELALEPGHHQQPVAVLTEADAPVKPMEEEMDEDIDDIQLMGERLDGVVPMVLGDETPTADSLLDEGIEASIVALVVEEDGTSVVLHDGTAVGEGRMAIAHLGVVVELVTGLAQELIAPLVVGIRMEEDIQVASRAEGGIGIEAAKTQPLE